MRNTRHKRTGKRKAPAAPPPMQPSATGGLDLGRQYPLTRYVDDLKKKAFENAVLRQSTRIAAQRGYDKDWGTAIVDQGLSDDPPPINGGAFQPVKRWAVVYRTAEAGLDGTHTVNVTDIRTAISGFSESTEFIIKQFHVWLAPNSVSTHFSGLLITQDDEVNGVLGGQYSDIAPYGEFVKFRVRYKYEGFTVSTATPGSKPILQIGGSAKWNGVVYAQLETYD